VYIYFVTEVITGCAVAPALC